MKNRNLRLIGLVIVVFALLLPLLSILLINTIPLITGKTTPRLLLSLRSNDDKQLALVQDSKVQFFDEQGCGDKQYPDKVTRFFIGEVEPKPQDPILDYFNTKKEETSCKQTTIPTLYLFDPSKKIFKELTIDEANKLEFDTTSIDKYRGKVSTKKESYTITYSKDIQYKIEPNQVTSISKIFGQPVSMTNSLPTPGFESEEQYYNYNPSIFEPLGFVK